MDCVTRIASLCCTVFLSLFLIGCVLLFFGSIMFSAQGAYVGSPTAHREAETAKAHRG